MISLGEAGERGAMIWNSNPDIHLAKYSTDYEGHDKYAYKNIKIKPLSFSSHCRLRGSFFKKGTEISFYST